MKQKVINLYGGPGAGKSTIASALFSELKFRGVSTEYVQEYAKDAVWEKRGEKVLNAQDYVFAKQHFRIFRVAHEVQFIITDSPILMSSVYCVPSYLPSMPLVIREAYDLYDNLDIFVQRNNHYDPIGRNQTLEEARQKDSEISNLLYNNGISPYHVQYGKHCIQSIIDILVGVKWLSA